MPGDAIATLDMVTIDMPWTAAVVELTPTNSPSWVVSGTPKMYKCSFIHWLIPNDNTKGKFQ